MLDLSEIEIQTREKDCFKIRFLIVHNTYVYIMFVVRAALVCKNEILPKQSL